MEALASCPHVRCKISGLTVQGKPWTLQVNGAVIRETIGMFGVNRCMFASNFPVDGVSCDYATLWNALKRVAAGRSADEKTALFKSNARKFYRLDSAVVR